MSFVPCNCLLTLFFFFFSTSSDGVKSKLNLSSSDDQKLLDDALFNKLTPNSEGLHFWNRRRADDRTDDSAGRSAKSSLLLRSWAAILKEKTSNY